MLFARLKGGTVFLQVTKQQVKRELSYKISFISVPLKNVTVLLF